MKKKITFLIIMIAVLIPSVVAIKYYFDTVNAPAGVRTALSVTVEDVEGNLYSVEKTDDADEMERVISFFLGINSRAVKVEGLPDSVALQKSFLVTIKTPVKDESYQYYISLTPSLCYLVNPSGVAFQLTESDGIAFLDSGYAECLFEGSKQPVLTVSGNGTASPSESSWSYRGYGGNFVKADTSRSTSSENSVYDAVGGLSLDFNIEPDLCQVKVTDNSGSLLFEDTLEALSSLRIDEEDATVKVEVSASWYEDTSREYYGEQKYDFTAKVTAPAIFYAMKPEVETGDVIAISAKRVSDPYMIGFSSEPDLGVAPKFYLDGEYAHAIIAIPTDAAAGAYTLRFTYGGASQNIDLSVSESKRADAYITVTADVLTASYSAEAKEEFDSLVEKLAGEVSEVRLFEGAFGRGVGEDAILKRGFGRRVIINNDESNSYVNLGVDYVTSAGYSIVAAAAGQVVYSGSTAYTGNIVVIEHGFGLKTWYWNLGDISVKAGDTVASGDTIGTAGTSGFNGGEAGVHVAMSVGADFVCPYDTWADGDGGILMQGVLENK